MSKTGSTAEVWLKTVGMLQQNWATIEPSKSAGVQICFITDTGGISDEMTFGSKGETAAGVSRNGFRRFADAPDLQPYLRAPKPPLRPRSHPNGPIYSSGRFWR